MHREKKHIQHAINQFFLFIFQLFFCFFIQTLKIFLHSEVKKLLYSHDGTRKLFINISGKRRRLRWNGKSDRNDDSWDIWHLKIYFRTNQNLITLQNVDNFCGKSIKFPLKVPENSAFSKSMDFCRQHNSIIVCHSTFSFLSTPWKEIFSRFSTTPFQFFIFFSPTPTQWKRVRGNFHIHRQRKISRKFPWQRKYPWSFFQEGGSALVFVSFSY